MGGTVRVVPVLLVLLASAPGLVSAACPPTRWTLYGLVVETTARSGSEYRNNGPYAQSEVFWSAQTGQIVARGHSYEHHASASASVSTMDDFEILGAPPGSEVTVTASLLIFGDSYFDDIYSYRTVEHGLLDGGGNNGALVTTPDGNRRLEHALTFVPGVPQRLTYQVRFYALGAEGSAEAYLFFRDLPPGMSIVSCRGFQAGAITAARGTTWGRLKQLYR
jgi:hypothetical protein